MKTRVFSGRLFAVMEKGESVAQDLRDLAALVPSPGSAAIVTGLGMVRNTNLGYGLYDGKSATYKKIIIEDNTEVLALSGFLIKDKELPFHVHISLGDGEMRVFGGHLFDAEVVTFLELCLDLSHLPLSRKLKDGLPEMKLGEPEV
ncbi:MAG TPA: DUF296 domain-containing protein [Rectinemataceae bacterium]